MNPYLIIRGVTAALELALRIAESRGYDKAELEDYIAVRNELREELVKQSHDLDDVTPSSEPQVSSQAEADEPDDSPIVGGQGTEFLP